MVFSIEKETKKILAAIQNGDIREHYECSLRYCDNPVCTCSNIRISLYPLEHEDQNNLNLPYRVNIDISKRKLEYVDEDNLPEGNLKFSNLLFSNLDDADFQFLWNTFYAYKNEVTEEATNDSIEAHFDYQDIEETGLMVEYNDVLPFGEQLMVTIDGDHLIIFDQYCVLPKCGCSETSLTMCSSGKFNEVGEELCSLTLDYRKKKWGMPEEQTTSVDIKTIRSAVEEQIPDIYKRLLNRHMKLKNIYSHCKKKHFEDIQELHPPKVGRNDPCPCGSGKKYKKCCGK